MDAKLVVVGGNAKPADIKLRLPVTIGRGRQATLVVPHPLVSRVHCEIYEADGQLVVRDLDSLNGTFINNKRIDKAVLPPGELLTLGSITFRAVYRAGQAAQPPSEDLPDTPPAPLPPDVGNGQPVDRDRRTEDMIPPDICPPDSAEEARTEAVDVDPEEIEEESRARRQDGSPG